MYIFSYQAELLISLCFFSDQAELLISLWTFSKQAEHGVVKLAEIDFITVCIFIQ